MADAPQKTAGGAQILKLQRAEDGRRAMNEYEAQVAAVAVKTARLRAARLAKEAADAAVAAAAPPPEKKVKKAARKVVATKKVVVE
jgi:hypothetical protein